MKIARVFEFVAVVCLPFAVGCAPPPTVQSSESTALSASHDEGPVTPTGDCTYSKGFWKNHQDLWPAADAEALLCDVAWSDVLTMPAHGDAWVILASQWIAAMLNVDSGVVAPDAVGLALADAETLLTDGCDGLASEDRAAALDLAELLDDFNDGDMGPGHCDDDGDDDDGGACYDDDMSCMGACVPSCTASCTEACGPACAEASDVEACTTSCASACDPGCVAGCTDGCAASELSGDDDHDGEDGDSCDD